MKRNNLTGKTFGQWSVIKYLGDRKYLCRCSCGVEKAVATSSLTSGRSTNCGNKSKHPIEGPKQFKDLKGRVFGELTAVEYEGNTMWKCTCLNGHTVSMSWKHLTPTSTCKECRYEKMRKPKPEKKAKIMIRDTMLGSRFRDLTVIEDLGGDRWKCRCTCGITREVRGYDLRHPFSDNAYRCRHKVKIGQRFGKLTVVGRKPDGTCICKCDCGNEKEVFVGNLTNGSTSSCGCIRVPTYSRKDVLDAINKYKKENGYNPFASELSELLGVGMTAVYGYIHNYGLEQFINTYYGSRSERDIVEYFKSRVDNVVVHDRKVLGGAELDLYLPEKKTAIEFNGNYWHSEDLKGKEYHQNKSIACAEKGIRLIHVFEYEWNNIETRKKLIALFNIIIGNAEIKYANKMEVHEINNIDALKFEDDNHLQGRANASISLGLFDKKSKELIGVMTFGTPRFTSGYEYELIRLCYRLDTIVVGGSEKLFKYFVNKYNPKSIISYCNLSKFSGKSYLRLGFNLCKEKPITQPNYVWVSNHCEEVLTRYSSSKQKLLDMGLGNKDMTEDEIMRSLRYNKIYDSGNLKFEYIDRR